MTIDDFLAEIRQNTRRGNLNLSIAERSQIGADLRERLMKLSDETARMTAFRKLLGVPGAPSQEILERALLADLAAVFAQLDRNRGEIRFRTVARTLVRLRDALDEAADELYLRARRPALAADVNSSRSKLPATVARVLDAMKHAIALPETAAETARNISARITKDKRDARKLLGEVALDTFEDVKLRKYLKRQIERFDKAPLNVKAGILADVAKRLPADSPARERFTALEEALKADQADDHRRRELVDVARKESAAGAALVDKLLLHLQPLPQRAIVNDCKRIADHFSDNMKLGDYAAAGRTLVALRRNVRLLDTGLPKMVDLDAPADKPADTDIGTADFDDEAFLPPSLLDWFARRAVMRIRAIGNPRLRRQNVAAEKNALLGEYGTAARCARGVGVMDFSRAAWHLEAAPTQPEELAEEYADPLPRHDGYALWPMNEEAYHACAIADLIGNRLAIQFARVGRYAKAAESMDEVAELFAGKARDMSFVAAEKYREAAEAQLEELPERLAQAIRRTEDQIPGLSGDAAKTLTRCAILTRQKQYAAAKVGLDQGKAYGKGVAAPYFNALGHALVSAANEAKLESEKQPKEIREAVEKIEMAFRSAGQLNEAVADIAQFELARARERIVQANYQRAATHLAVAANLLQGSDRQTIRDLADQMLSLDADTYTSMNPPGRRALQLLDRRRPEVIEAALNLDYMKAAKLADKLGERDAAAAFREAAAYQTEALGADVIEAIEQLKEAARAPDLSGENQSLILQAARFLREDRMTDALRSIEIVTTPLTSRLELAQAVQQAVAFSRQHVTPLIEAQAFTRKNRFDLAADITRKSRFGGDALAILLQAEETTDNGIRAALRAGFEEKSRARRISLETAAKHARNNDLISAIARANAAGMAGRVAAQRFVEARRLGEEADRLLEEAVARAKGGNTPAQAALQAIDEETKGAPPIVKRLLMQVGELLRERRYTEAAQMARRIDPGALLAFTARQRLQRDQARPAPPQRPRPDSDMPSTYMQDLNLAPAAAHYPTTKGQTDDASDNCLPPRMLEPAAGRRHG